MTLERSTAVLRDRSRVAGPIAAQVLEGQQQLENGGGSGGGGSGDPNANVTLGCFRATPFEVVEGESPTVSVSLDLQNNTDEDQDISVNLLVAGERVAGPRDFTVPPEGSTPTIQTEVDTSILPAAGGSADVTIQQRFGRQQEVSCGSIDVITPEQDEIEPLPPSDGGDEGGAGGGGGAEGPLVEVGCDSIEPAEVQPNRGFTLQATARFANQTDESHPITYDVLFDGEIVTGTTVTVPGGQTATDTLTTEIPASMVPSPGSNVDVTIQQRFGRQQEASCGTIAVAQREADRRDGRRGRPAELPLPPEQLAIGGAVLLLVLLIATR